MNATLPLGKSARRAVLAVLVLALAVACGPEDSLSSDPDGQGAGPEGAELVYDVSAINVEVLESAPLQIRITATGHTRTGGWANAALVLDEEESAGIRLVYHFLAVPPSGMATQAITPVTASVNYGPWVDRAVRQIDVVAQTNQQTIIYPGPAEE